MDYMYINIYIISSSKSNLNQNYVIVYDKHREIPEQIFTEATYWNNSEILVV